MKALWLWQQLAAAGDRRGDRDLIHGTLTVTAPPGAAERAATSGLFGGRPLAAGARRRVNLADLTGVLLVHGPLLTPGSVAAHATGRPLAVLARERDARSALDAELAERLSRLLGAPPMAALPSPSTGPEQVWAELRRIGWVSRIMSAENPHRLIDSVIAVLAALPTGARRADRRHLAEQVLDDPHGLDDGTPEAGLALAMLAALGTVPPGIRSRDAWNTVGVDFDDLTGGLLSVGIQPTGWSLPHGAVVTLPPRELATAAWPAPATPGAWVFVTENPSVLGAYARQLREAPDSERVRAPSPMLCTVGTPSAIEVSAVARIAAVGWRVAVRADFDDAGLAHVTTLLAGVPGAVPWRMSCADHELTLARSPAAPALRTTKLRGSTWDPALVEAMRRDCRAGYEETLTGELVADAAQGSPA